MGQQTRLAARKAVVQRLADATRQRVERDRRIKDAAVTAAAAVAEIEELKSVVKGQVEILVAEGLTVPAVVELIGIDPVDARQLQKKRQR